MDSIDRAMAYEAREREKFERWAKANTQLKLDRDLASYFSGTTQFAWMAWIERAVEAHAAADGVQAPAPAEPKPALIEINYELGGRWWHMNCHDKDGKYMPSGIMREVERDKEAKRSLIRCMRCGERGYYQFGWVGLARVPMEPSTAGVGVCTGNRATCRDPMCDAKACEVPAGVNACDGGQQK